MASAAAEKRKGHESQNGAPWEAAREAARESVKGDGKGGGKAVAQANGEGGVSDGMAGGLTGGLTQEARMAQSPAQASSGPPEPKNVHEAKLAVMTQVCYVQKRDPKKEQRPGERTINYTYGAEADFIRSLRGPMVEAGLVAAPVAVEGKSEDYPTKSGTLMHRHVVKVTYRLTHAPSGTFEDVVVEGEAADVGDKSVPKAMTQALKAFLKHCFLIETGDEDPDAVNGEQYAREDPTKGPLGDSYVRILKAVQESSSVVALDAIVLRAYPNPKRSANYSPTQLHMICQAASVRRAELVKKEMADAAKGSAENN